MLKNHYNLFLPMFIYSRPTTKTASYLEDIFVPQFSLEQSSKRRLEEETASNWIVFLTEIEAAGGNLAVQHPNSQSGDSNINITFEDILAFATGATDIPPMGFESKPTISFDANIKFPTASACANVLTLPLGQSYEEFERNFSFVILNSYGFMCLCNGSQLCSHY